MKPFQFSNQLPFMFLEAEESRLGVKNGKTMSVRELDGLMTADILDTGGPVGRPCYGQSPYDQPEKRNDETKNFPEFIKEVRSKRVTKLL
jgi:hypothetical protein